MHSAGPPHPPPSAAQLSSLEAMHNMSRERELMAFMLANGARLDPMTLAALTAGPLQVYQLFVRYPSMICLFLSDATS